MTAGHTTQGRIRSNRRRAARNKPPKLTTKFRNSRRLQIESKYVIRHDQYLKVRDVVRASGVARYLNERLHSHRGERCTFDAETLLIGVVLTGTLGLELEHTNITSALASLSIRVRRERGLFDDWGNPASYRAINHQLGRMARVLDTGWTAQDGTRCDLRWMLVELLRASVPAEYRGYTALAIDATAVETWGAFITSAAEVAADPDVMSAAEAAAEMYADLDEVASLDAVLVDAAHASADESAERSKAAKRRKSQRRAPSPDTIYGPDGRIIHTTDIDARGGYRTSTSMQSGRTFVGYHLHLATAVRSFAWQGDVTRGILGRYVPPFILGSELTPANSHSGEAATRLLDAIVPTAPELTEVLADRGYTMMQPETFIWPARAHGLDVVMDYSEAQRKLAPTLSVAKRSVRTGTDPNSVIVNCGTVLHEHTPEPMLAAPAIPKEAALRDPVFRFYENRAQLYRWSVNDRDRITGDVQFICPFHAGRAKNPAFKPGARPSGKASFVDVPDDATVCCRGSATIDPESLGPLWQPVPYGTRAWFTSHGRRAMAETANSLLKTSFARLQRSFIKVMGKAKVGLLVGLLCVAVNIELAAQIDENGAPLELSAEERQNRKAKRSGRQRRERVLAELAKSCPDHDPSPPGEPPAKPGPGKLKST